MFNEFVSVIQKMLHCFKNHREIVFIVSAQEGYTISVIFVTLSLGYSSRCSDGYIEIDGLSGYDGKHIIMCNQKLLLYFIA